MLDSIGNEGVLLIEVVVKCRAIVSAVGFGPQIERHILDGAVESGEVGKEALEDLPCTDCANIGCVESRTKIQR